MMKQLFFMLLMVTYSFAVSAQVQEQLTPEERKQLTRVTEPVTLYKGFLKLRTFSQYAPFDQVFDEQGSKVHYNQSVNGYTLLLMMNLSYGITDRLEASLDIPFILGHIKSSYNYQIPNSGESGTTTGSVEYKSLGDIITTLRYQVLRDRPGSPALVLGLSAYLPTGQKDPSNVVDELNYQAPISKGEPGVAAEFRLRKISYPFSFELGMSYSHFFGAMKIIRLNEQPVEVVSGPEFLIRPQINFHLNPWISFTNYVDYYRATKDSFEGEDTVGAHNNEYDQWAIRYYPAINFQIKRIRLEQAVLIPLAGRTMTADPAYFLSIDYVF